MTAFRVGADHVDLVVIGGGVIGAGIARDAARRGLTVALFERDDFGSGTTAARALPSIDTQRPSS